MIRTTFKEFAEIHYANYADNAKAAHLFNIISNKVFAASWAYVDHLPEFEDYCEVTE